MNLGDLTVKIGADTSDLMAKVEAATDDILKFGAVAGVAGEVASQGIGLITSVIGHLTEIIPNAVEKASDFAEQLNRVSVQTGLSTQFIQGMTPALNAAGLTSANLSQAFRQLSQHIEAAQNPTSRQAELFNKLGLDARALGEPGQALPLIAEQLSKMPNGFEKTTIGTQLLGRAYMQLAPMLNEGAAGFEESQRKAADMGLILSGPALSALENMHTAMEDSATASESLSLHIAVAFAPMTTLFENASISAKKLAISLVDDLGVAMQTLTARAQGLWGFLKEQAQLPLSAGIQGIIDAYKKWDGQTAETIESIRNQTIVVQEQSALMDGAVQKWKAANQQAAAMAQLQTDLGEAFRNAAIAARQLDEQEYGTKNMKAAIELSGRFLETITPAQMADQLEKGNAIVRQSMLERAMAISEYGKEAVATAERVNAEFGAGTTTPQQVNEQEQLGQQALHAFEQTKAINAMRLQDEVTMDHAIMAEQSELYRNEMGFIGAAAAARRVANTALEAEQAQARNNLKLQLDGGTIDYQSYQTRLEALEVQGTAKRMQIISQYPTFVEKQLGDLVNANVFSLSQISTTFTQNISKMIVEGGKLSQMWRQLQETMVQSALNAGVQMLANTALNFLKETELAETMEQSKTTIAEAMGIERMAVAESEQEVTAAGAAGTLAQIGALAEAGSVLMTATMEGVGVVFDIIAAALDLTVYGSALSEGFYEAGTAVEFAAPIAGAAMMGVVQPAIEEAGAVIGATSAVPKLASGGIVTGPTFAMVGEAGPEAVIPLDRLSAQGDQSHTIIIELDGKTIAKNTMENMPRIVRMRGMTR